MSQVINQEGNYDLCSINAKFQQPVHLILDKNTLERQIDINILVINLPFDILVKIYNDYFRPHKFAQLFKGLTQNVVFDPKLYILHMNQFIHILHMFMYSSIKQYIMRIDKEFNDVMTDLAYRGYTSRFTLFASLKRAIFLEILMNKYH